MDRIELNGFLIDVVCPSEHRLDVEIDASDISWKEYRSLIEELQDILSDIDDKYSINSWLLKGRSLKARYRRISSEDRKRKIRFSPLPSRFRNTLIIARNHLYSMINEYCVLLEKAGSRKLWILPKLLAPKFVEVVEELNKEVIDKLNKDIDEFMDSQDYLKIKQCLHKHGIDPKVIDLKYFSIPYFTLHLVPIDFGYSVDTDEVFRKIKEKEALDRLEKLKKYIEERHREYAATMVSEIVSKIVNLVSNSKMKKKKKLINKIDEMMDLCSSLNLEPVNEKILKPLKEIFSDYAYKRSQLSKKFFGTDDLKLGVENAFKELGFT
ncbi:hypothetical protein J7K27_10735 [Candidatus Bathyarchaeota archaeon]|nr:hypothetical protein [Candidatus Bathyarchaeota archaeon]